MSIAIHAADDARQTELSCIMSRTHVHALAGRGAAPECDTLMNALEST